MMRVFRSAWRLVVKRAAADWLILSAALITVIMATALLAAGPIYANAVTLSGAQRTLADAPVADANILVRLRTPPDGIAAADERAVGELTWATAAVGAEIVRRFTSESYELPVQETTGATDLALFRAFDELDGHATIESGTWPADVGAGPLETAVSAAVAGQLGVEVGDELVLTNRRDRSIDVDVRIVGIYRLDDPGESYWYDDPLDVGGREIASSFVTHGPFIVTRDSLLSRLSPRNTLVEWRVFPDYDQLAVRDLGAIRDAVDRLEDRLNVGIEDRQPEFVVETGLERILADIERSLTVTRSGVVMLSVQLSILAGYALVLTAGLLVESRLVEMYLLRSRGASSAQVVLMAIMEGLALTLPAAAIAPWLAGRAMTLLNGVGPLSFLDLAIRASNTPSALVLSFLAAVGCVVALAVPAYRSSRWSLETTRPGRRQRSRSAGQRAGFDVALLALAAVAFWQLNVHGPSITSQVRGTLGIDPLLIAAPALGLVAGAVLALRTIPLAAAVAERLASRGRSTVRALSAWQISRRPVRYARAGLLLVMAITIGFFTAAYTTTWSQSQNDQADFQTGADLRVAPNRRTNDSVDDLHLRTGHLQLDGVELSMPVVSRTAELSRATGNGRFVMLDALQAADIVRIREDLTSSSFPDLMELLAAQRPTVATIPLPGQPTRLGVVIAVDPAPLPDISGLRPWTPAPEQVDQPEHPDFRLRPSARVVVQDRFGILHRLSLGPIPVDGAPAMVFADLTGGDQDELAPAYPLAVVDLEIVSPAPFGAPRQADFTISGLFVSSADNGSEWDPVDVSLAPHEWMITTGRVAGLASFPSIDFAGQQTDHALRLDINSGQSPGGFRASPTVISFSIRPAGTQLPSSFPIVVTERFLDVTSTVIGDEVTLSGLRATLDKAMIVGSVLEFPTVDPALAVAVVLDLPTFQMLNYEVGGGMPPADEYWIGASGPPGLVAEELGAAPFEAVSVLDRIDRANALKTDPVALGTIGALALGFVAAAVFAGTGFAVSATVSARERLTEFGLLRALGLSQRQLGSWLAIEQGVLVVASLVIGTLIGILLATVILPLIAITQQGRSAIPDIIVIYPWATVFRLEAAVIAVLLLTVLGLAVALRRLGLGSLLRLGED